MTFFMTLWLSWACASDTHVPAQAGDAKHISINGFTPSRWSRYGSNTPTNKAMHQQRQRSKQVNMDINNADFKMFNKFGFANVLWERKCMQHVGWKSTIQIIDYFWNRGINTTGCGFTWSYTEFTQYQENGKNTGLWQRNGLAHNPCKTRLFLLLCFCMDQTSKIRCAN